MNEEHTAALNDYAIRCFRNTADRDYVHARLAYRHGLIPQFRWSSLHCLEKYGKCILLLNRIDGRKINKKTIGHGISESIKRIDDSQKLDLELSDRSKNFIILLERNASDRYLDYSWHNHQQHLPDLDFAVWEIRRFCQVLKYVVTKKEKRVDITDKNIERIKKFKRPWNSSQFLIGGWLEKIIRDKKNPSRAALVWNNLYFSFSRRKSITYREINEAENAPVDLCPEIKSEVDKYVVFYNK